MLTDVDAVRWRRSSPPPALTGWASSRRQPAGHRRGLPTRHRIVVPPSTPQTFRRVIDINVNGVFHTCGPPSLSSAGATCWSSRPPRPGWPRTTPARRQPSTSPTRCGSRWTTTASRSAPRTCPGSTPRSSRTPSRDLSAFRDLVGAPSVPAQPHLDRRPVRPGVRRRPSSGAAGASTSPAGSGLVAQARMLLADAPRVTREQTRRSRARGCRRRSTWRAGAPSRPAGAAAGGHLRPSAGVEIQDGGSSGRHADGGTAPSSACATSRRERVVGVGAQ